MRPFYPAWVAVFLLWTLGDVLIHGVLLVEGQGALPNLFRSRTETQTLFPVLMAAHAVMAWAFVWMYRQGLRSGPWFGQGLRFGVVVALLLVVPMACMDFVMHPMPMAWAVKQLLAGVLLHAVLGVVVGYFHRHASWSHSKF